MLYRSLYIFLKLPSSLTFALILLLAGCTNLPNPDAQDFGSVNSNLCVPVMYVTNRAPADENEFGFSSKRGVPVSGITYISLDKNAVQDSRYANTNRWTHAGAMQEDLGLKLCEGTKALSRPYGQLSLYPQADTVMLYVHGAGRTLTESAEHMAMMLVEMDFKGTPVMFSWPAGGNSIQYVADIANTDWSVPHLSELLTDLLTGPQYQRIIVIAHSLGNRLLLNVLKQISAEQQAMGKISDIVMMAPDVDRELFSRDFMPIMNRLDAKKTLYVSNKDVPLKVSAMVNGVARLGDASAGVPVFEGIDTIDVSAAHNLFKAHSAYRNNAQMQEDLHELLELQLSAEKRSNLTLTTDESVDYWTIQPDSDMTNASEKP